MAWPVGWILIGWITLLVLDHVRDVKRTGRLMPQWMVYLLR
jgi:hypothetical protein